jgi:hypothetical protein
MTPREAKIRVQWKAPGAALEVTTGGFPHARSGDCAPWHIPGAGTAAR